MKDETELDNKSISGTEARHPRHIQRTAAGESPNAVEVDSSAFFAAGPQPAETKEPKADIERAPRLDPPPPLTPPSGGGNGSGGSSDDAGRSAGDTRMPKRGVFMLILQAVLSIAALVQLWRTQMLPVRYLGALAVLLILFWVVVYYCQRWRASGAVARVFSLALCAVMALGCVWAQQGLAALDGVTSGLISGTEANKITQEPFVLYLSGVDTRGELTENARSDVNILAIVNPETKRVALVNTPRDYYVDLAGTQSKDKLTHAGLYGVETSMATLGQLYDVDVEHYIRINFAGFISIVDAIGGVDVYSDQAFTSVGSPGYYDPTTFVEGWNHLDGKAALAFARERHAFATGDVQRGINQMKVIDAMLNKIKSPALLMSFSKLMDAAADCFVTSLSSEQISALVRMQLNDMAEWSIESYTVTGTSGKSTKCYSAQGQSLYVMLPDDDSVNEARALIQSVLTGEEGAAASSSYSSSEHDAYSATGDANAAVPSVDETPAESEIELSADSAQAAESEAAAESAAAAESEAAASAGESASSEAAAGSEASGDGSAELPSQSELEQAASSMVDALGEWFGTITQAQTSEQAS